MAEKYLMISLNDKESKNLAEVLGNENCKRVVNLLAEKNASASEISNQLNIPLNTATYNIEKLIKVGLIEKESHWWSVKGRKIPIYQLSNKQILISARKSNLGKLKTIIPVVLLSGLAALGINYYANQSYLNELSYESARSAGDMNLAAPMAAGLESISPSIFNFSWLWFLVGCLFAIISYLIFEKYNERRVNKNG